MKTEKPNARFAAALERRREEGRRKGEAAASLLRDTRPSKNNDSPKHNLRTAEQKIDACQSLIKVSSGRESPKEMSASLFILFSASSSSSSNLKLRAVGKMS